MERCSPTFLAPLAGLVDGGSGTPGLRPGLNSAAPDGADRSGTRSGSPGEPSSIEAGRVSFSNGNETT